VITLLACVAGRAAHVRAIAALQNRAAARDPDAFPEIPANYQAMLWFAGLRGAVAFSCAGIFPDDNGHRALFATTTSAVIVVTMFAGGAGTPRALAALGIPVGEAGADAPPSPRRAPAPPRLVACLAALDRRAYPCLVADPDLGAPLKAPGVLARFDPPAEVELAAMTTPPPTRNPLA